MNEPLTKSLLQSFFNNPTVQYWTNVGIWLLGIALLVHLIYEMIKLSTTGKADFFSPLAKIAFGAALISLLPLIGSTIQNVAMGANVSGIEKSSAKLLEECWANSFQVLSEGGTWDFLENLFDIKTLMYLSTWLQLQAMLIVKILLLDIVWPTILGVIVIMGCLSIPLGSFPAMGSYTGWIRNVVEIALWPIVFGLMFSVMTTVFDKQIGQFKHLEPLMAEVSNNEDAIQDYLSNYNRSGIFGKEGFLYSGKLASGYTTYDQVIKAEKDNKEIFKKYTYIPSRFGLWIQYLAMNTAFIFLILGTPVICRIIVRTESASAIGSTVIGGATALATYVGYKTLAAASKFSSGAKGSLTGGKQSAQQVSAGQRPLPSGTPPGSGSSGISGTPSSEPTSSTQMTNDQLLGRLAYMVDRYANRNSALRQKAGLEPHTSQNSPQNDPNERSIS